MKIFVTKYALTKGIQEQELDHETDGMAVVILRPGCYYPGTQYLHGEEWHRTLSGAIAKAEKMRDVRIASLERSLAKTRSLDFG